MFLLSTTRLQFSFKDSCISSLKKYEINNTTNAIFIEKFNLIHNIPAFTNTFQYYLSEYPMTSSLNMQFSGKTQFK